MLGAALLFIAAVLGGPRALPVVPPEGIPLPNRVELEWVGPNYRSLGVTTRPISNGTVSLESPPVGAESVRIVGPDLLSLPLPLNGGSKSGIRLAVAGKLLLLGVPKGVTTLRVFMTLEGSDLEYWREMQTVGSSEVEFAVPLGAYAAAVDLGHERVPIIVPSIVIGVGSAARIDIADIKEAAGRDLTFRVVTKEDGKPIAGASISGRPTADFPEVFWRALGARCGVTEVSGVLACGTVPAALRNIDVQARRRRFARVPIAVSGTMQLEAGSPPPIHVALASYQSVAIAATLPADYPAEAIEGLKVVLLRCDRHPCDESKAVRKELGSRQSAEFSQVEPGLYSTWLQGPVARSISTSVAIAGESGEPDTVDVSLELQLWRIVGSARLPDGLGVPAKIWLTILREGQRQAESGGIHETDATGVFEVSLLAPAGVYVSVHAASENPPAEGKLVPGLKLEEGQYRIPLDIELSTVGAVVRLVDEKTKEPIPDCQVLFSYWGRTEGGAMPVKSDADGVARRLGISGSKFTARAQCKGYAPASTEKLEISDTSKEITLELKQTGEIRLRVRDFSGSLLPGARVFAEQSTFENVTYPFQIPAETVGVTDLEGEIAILPRARPGFYVLAAGHALYVARLAPCLGESGCVQDVLLTRPVAFPGLRVRNAAGEPVEAAWLVFSKDGVPIPVSVQADLLRVNQASAQQLIILEGLDTVHMLPGLFGPGVYEVEYTEQRQDGPRARIPLARMVLPATIRIELTLPASVPVSN